MSFSNCITDCSILNQTTCKAVTARQLQINQEQIFAHLWYPDGCYNTTLFKATDGYKLYEKVKDYA